MELRRKSTNIIFDDAELDRAIPGSATRIFAALRQTFIAGSRLLIYHSVYDRALQGILERIKSVRFGNPQDMITDIGPEDNGKPSHHCIGKAEKDGANLLAGGRTASKKMGGLFVTSTVFGDIGPKVIWHGTMSLIQS